MARDFDELDRETRVIGFGAIFTDIFGGNVTRLYLIREGIGLVDVQKCKHAI